MSAAVKTHGRQQSNPPSKEWLEAEAATAQRFHAGRPTIRTARVFALGLVARVLLCWWRVGPALSKRLELVVPASMFERAVEGAFLAERGYSPYAGGVFQGSPVLLGLARLSRALPANYEPACTAAVFIIVDLAVALLLHYLTRTRLNNEPSAGEAELERHMPATRKPAPSRSLLLAPANLPDTVAAVFLLNPITAAQCAAHSAEVLARLPLLAALCAAHQGAALIAAAAALGVSCVCFELHSFVLLPAVALLAAQAAAPAQTFTTFEIPAAGSIALLLAVFTASVALCTALCSVLCSCSLWSFAAVAAHIWQHPHWHFTTGGHMISLAAQDVAHTCQCMSAHYDARLSTSCKHITSSARSCAQARAQARLTVLMLMAN
eukprot:14216-Heterococcus_DN1.PRE.5